MQMSLSSRHNAPCPDQVIRVPSEQSLSIGAPCKTNTLWLTALLSDGGVFGLEFVNLALLLEIENDDAGRSGSTEPVAVGGENEGMDLIACGQGVEVLGFVEVPEHGCAILSA